MQTSTINTEVMDLNMALDFHKREVNAKDIAKTESNTSKDKTAGKFGSKEGGPVSDPTPNQAPLFGNMFFQVCGGMQSTLAALQGVIFENEAKLMDSGTKIAQLDSIAEGKASQKGYAASVASGVAQEHTMQISATQSFVTAGVSIASAAIQIHGDHFSEDAGKLDTLKTKLGQQEKLSGMVRPGAEASLGKGLVTDKATLAADTGTPKASEDAETIKLRQQDIAGGKPFSKFDKTKYPQEAGKEGSYYVKGLDEDAVATMSPEDKAAAYKSLEDQIKTTKLEINSAETAINGKRQMISTCKDLATSLTQATGQTVQAPLAVAQKTQDGVATVNNQAVSTLAAAIALAAKQRDTAAEEGKNTVAAVIQAMNIRG